MNAIRSLPLINRPRTATPVTTPVTGTATVPPLGPPPVPERARQPQAVVAPAPVLPTPRPVSASRKGVSPPGSRSGTPRVGAAPLPPTPDGGHGGHVDAISIRLNDVVNKASVGVDFKHKKGFRQGSGWAVGEAIANELPPPPADTYLLRAVLRTTVRALSIYVTRLDSLLLPALSDPQFAAAMNLTPGAHPLNATQAFAVSVAHAAWETCERLEEMLDPGKYPRFVEDTLRPTMDKFDTVVGKVVRPLLAALKNDLEASIKCTTGCTAKAIPTSVPAPNTPPVPLTREKSNPGVARLTKEASGGGHARTLAVPTCLQQFASRVDGARKAMEIIAAPCGHDGEGWAAKIVVAVVWRGMRVITENDTFALGGAPSPSSVHKALKEVGKEPTPTVVASPSLAKITSLSILTPKIQSRPPSPPRPAARFDMATHSLMSFQGLVKRLVNGLVQPPTAPPSAADSDDQELEHIAREALHEALEALDSAIIASAAVHGDNAAGRLLASLRRLRDDVDDTLDEKLDDALEDLPSVFLFQVLLWRANAALAHVQAPPLRGPGETFGWSAGEYERQVMSGFGPAEEWGPRVARALKPEVESALVALNKDDAKAMDAVEWVRVLGVALDARAGVKVARAL